MSFPFARRIGTLHDADRKTAAGTGAGCFLRVYPRQQAFGKSRWRNVISEKKVFIYRYLCCSKAFKICPQKKNKYPLGFLGIGDGLVSKEGNGGHKSETQKKCPSPHWSKNTGNKQTKNEKIDRCHRTAQPVGTIRWIRQEKPCIKRLRQMISRNELFRNFCSRQ